jgi:hypothetical protein
MAQFTITIDDSLAPGIIATASLEGKTPEEVVNEAAEAAATKACQDFKVGPYYTGPTPPQFNADGTPYVAQQDSAHPCRDRRSLGRRLLRGLHQPHR